MCLSMPSTMSWIRFSNLRPRLAWSFSIYSALHLSYPATTPLFLARYCVISAGDVLRHRFDCTGEIHYVLQGKGMSTNGHDETHWSVGDLVCFPGGGETVHRAEEDSLLFTATNEPELCYTHAGPRSDSPVVAAVFRADRIAHELEALQEATGAQTTAGRSVSFTTPAMSNQVSGALMPSMMAAVNSLDPDLCNVDIDTIRWLSRCPLPERACIP